VWNNWASSVIQQSHAPDLLMEFSACIFAGKGHVYAADADYEMHVNSAFEWQSSRMMFADGVIDFCVLQ